MRRLLILLAASILSYSCQHSDKKVTSDNVVRIGVVDSIFSKVLNEQRKIWVYIPKEDSFHAKKRYPVMYLLDGDGHFSSTVGIVQQLSSVNGNTVCPEMIIVGIPNTDRTRDLTPTKAGGYFDGDTTILSTSGGAENFTKFIETELIPYIDKSYATTDHRVIIGHSFGGLFVVNTLLNHSSVFSNYIAIDPSLWWDKNRLVKNSIGRLKGEKYKNKSLFVAVANTLNPGMRLDEAFSDTTQNTKHIRSILEFIEETKRNNDGALVINSKYYENDSHGSVPLIATYDAIRFFYSWYEFKNIDNDYFDPKSSLPIDTLLSDINHHYENVSERMGYKILPPESMINELGYYFVKTKKFENAFKFFSLNLSNYPTSASAFDSMGDYYLSVSDTLKAVNNFEAALKIVNAPGTDEKLKMLRNQRTGD